MHFLTVHHEYQQNFEQSFMRRVRAEDMYISQSSGSRDKQVLLGLCALRAIYPASITG